MSAEAASPSLSPSLSSGLQPARPGYELLLTRLVTGGIGLVAGLAGLGMMTVVEQPDAVPMPAPYRVALLALFLFAVLLGAVAFLSRLAFLRIMNGVLVAWYLVLLVVLWPLLLLTDAAPPSGQLNWLLTVIALPVLSAVIAGGSVGGWVVLGVLGIGVPVLRLAIGDVGPNAITNDVHAVSTALLLCLFSGAVLSSARDADRAAALARAAAMGRAQELARRSAQLRAQTLVHDEVLATFGFAARATETMLSALAEQARRARELVRALAEPEASGEVPTRTLELELRALADANGARFEAWIPVPGLRLPAEAAGALLGAAQQALQNSVQHAAGSLRRLIVEGAPQELRIVVSDDGPGFDPELPRATQRMGIAVSILGRMNALAGGSAELRTAPGSGTTVVLGWRGPDEASASGPVPGSVPGAVPAASANEMHKASLSGRGFRIAGTLVAAGSLLLAVFEGRWWADPAVGAAVAAGLVAMLLIVTWSAATPRWPTLLSLGLVGAATVGTLLLRPLPASPSYSDYGVFPSAAIALGLFCLRGRPLLALLLFGVNSAVLALAVMGHGIGQLPSSFARGLAIVLVGVLLAYGHRTLRRSAARSRDAETVASASRAWDLALNREIAAASARLVRKVEPLLRRLETGAPLSSEEAAECVVLEGSLRDEYRGGRLAGGPVPVAAAAARRRGVDVMLIDDVPQRTAEDDVVRNALRWLADELAGVTAGSFTARVLPADRDALVSAVANGRVASFQG